MLVALRNRPGIGLPIAMGATAIIGLLITAGAFASMHAYRIDRNTLFQERALAVAEEGQARIVRDWSPAWNSKAVGDTLMRSYTTLDGSTANVVVTRLNAHTFWVTSDAASNQSSRQFNTRRRTNLLLRLNVPNMRISGAVSAREATRATGNALMNGNDASPPGWSCDPAGTSIAAIATDSIGDSGTTGNCSGDACLTTSSATKRIADSLLRDTSAFSQFGGLNYDTLKTQAATAGMGTVIDVPSGGLTLSGIAPTYNLDLSCQTANPKNWGDYTRNSLVPGSCETHFPVVHLRGAPTSTTTINGNGGQGILIVDGNLVLAGTFQWYGPIIVRGNVKLAGNAGQGGIKVFGGIMAANLNCQSTDAVNSPCNQIEGASTVQFSRCAITAAVTKNARTVLATRSWADLF